MSFINRLDVISNNAKHQFITEVAMNNLNASEYNVEIVDEWQNNPQHPIYAQSDHSFGLFERNVYPNNEQCLHEYCGYHDSSFLSSG